MLSYDRQNNYDNLLTNNELITAICKEITFEKNV